MRGALAEIVGIANSFYIVGAVGMAMLAVLAIWVATSPSFRDGEPTNPS